MKPSKQNKPAKTIGIELADEYIRKYNALSEKDKKYALPAIQNCRLDITDKLLIIKCNKEFVKWFDETGIDITSATLEMTMKMIDFTYEKAFPEKINF